MSSNTITNGSICSLTSTASNNNNNNNSKNNIFTIKNSTNSCINFNSQVNNEIRFKNNDNLSAIKSIQNNFDIEFGFDLSTNELTLSNDILSDENILECSSSLSRKLNKENNLNIKMETNGIDVMNNNINTEQQRRNKKRKPPNYYQNEEIAAILKNTESIQPSASMSADLPTSNSSSSSSPQTTLADNDQNENKNLQENTIEETTKGLEEFKITENNKLNMQEDKDKSSSNSSNDQSSNKSWSSLFKIRQEAAALAPPVPKQQPKLSNNQNPKNLVTNPTLPPVQQVSLNQTGYSQSSSASSVSTASLSNNSEQSLSDSFKTVGNLLKNCELKHSAPALQPRGLRNRQNWCYINATLQALLACPPFYNLIKNVYNKIKSSNASLQTVPFISALGRFIGEFKVMVRSTSTTDQVKLSASNGKELIIGDSFEIDYFYDALASVKSEITFKSGRQEDAQEFLSFLLNRVHEEMVKCLESLNSTVSQIEYTQLNGTKTSTDEINNNQDDADEWKEVGKKNRALITRKAEFKQSPLSDIFCGQFRSALSQSGAKDKESASLEPFFTLPLDIQSDSIRNINQALEHFVQREEVHGLTHQETKQEIEAYKRVSFEDLPPVLILYLKCFVYDKQGGIQKLLKRIDFQIDLEINKELISSGQRSKLKDKRNKYKLFAVEYHYGEKATGGHYITDVYHPGIISWVRYDDANVRICNNQQVLKSDDKKLVPYLLYYRRADLI